MGRGREDERGRGRRVVEICSRGSSTSHLRTETMSLKMKTSGAINGIIVADQNGRKYVKTQPQEASAQEALFEQTNTVGALQNKVISIRKAQGTLSSRFPVKIRLRKS